MIARLAAGILATFAQILNPAQAGLIEYTLTLHRSLVHGSETIGGPASPVMFKYYIDSATPNISGGTDEGIYSTLPLAEVSVGGVTTRLDGGTIRITNWPTGLVRDIFDAGANGDDDGTRINGRSLFVASTVMWTIGEMFDSIDLPMTGEFSSQVTGGVFQLIFRPKPDDPEFQTRDYVRFDTRIGAGDVEVDVRVISEPLTIALLGLGLAGLAAARRRKQ